MKRLAEGRNEWMMERVCFSFYFVVVAAAALLVCFCFGFH